MAREGSLEAPTRHPLGQDTPEFWQEDKLFAELERVFDICHGCRRCVNLCGSFPTLFDLVDESDTFEVDGVAKIDYWKVIDDCFLCDLCYLTKCPYVPPHEWNVDFPHLMLRAKAIKFKNGKTKKRDNLITSTDALGKLASIPVIAQTVNAINRNGFSRSLLIKLWAFIQMLCCQNIPPTHWLNAIKNANKITTRQKPAKRPPVKSPYSLPATAITMSHKLAKT